MPGSITALQRVAFLERALQIGDRSGIRQAFDGFHLRAVALHGEGQAAAHGLAVEQHRAGAAHAMFAADMAAGQRKILAKKIDQGLARLDAGRDGSPFTLSTISKWRALIFARNALARPKA